MLVALQGTDYMPDFSDKILLLESLGGRVPQMHTYLSQLQQLGAFDKVTGILLGTFTEMEKENCKPTIVEIVKQYAKEDLPIAVTKDIGHGANSKAIVIGKELSYNCFERSRYHPLNHHEYYRLLYFYLAYILEHLRF